MDGERLALDGYHLAVDETFAGPRLDPGRWFPHYTPHWADLASTAARFEVGDGLRLRIDVDTPPWSPEFDGEVRVSHLQTGHFSGPVGSTVGQHRFRDGLVVRSAHPELALWHVGRGVLEVRARAIAHPDAMVACWPIGVERDPRDSGEVCLFEIFGSELDASGGLVGVGVKAHHDDRLVDDVERVRVDGDLTQFHDYAMEWLPDRIRFFIDGELVKASHQVIDYPLQLMLDVYELPPGASAGSRDLTSLPHVFEVAHVRSWV